MNALDSTAWEAALARLLEDVYTFARSGPRLHGDWAEDVLAVMARAVADPRGWASPEWRIDDAVREAGHPFHPFRAMAAEEVRGGGRGGWCRSPRGARADPAREMCVEASPQR
ncbi:hypothetical protein ACFVHW_12140, partial [Streptomyces sp. NPDC127110]